MPTKIRDPALIIMSILLDLDLIGTMFLVCFPYLCLVKYEIVQRKPLNYRYF